ncbi:hypothetical protein B9Z55_006957 [Caenorhabditis nigoni]|uniref:BHLH domain-containing protein n=1 Tax=Caenorhabditis nigoni TaxID=1611254 RepID=A0A2G5V7T0_9PELO|nr:hypothetical protein B9Z55_006957 [Caenorhabditis nigoni]
MAGKTRTPVLRTQKFKDYRNELEKARFAKITAAFDRLKEVSQPCLGDKSTKLEILQAAMERIRELREELARQDEVDHDSSPSSPQQFSSPESSESQENVAEQVVDLQQEEQQDQDVQWQYVTVTTVWKIPVGTTKTTSN